MTTAAIILIEKTEAEAVSDPFHITKKPNDKSGPDVYRRIPTDSTFQAKGLIGTDEYFQLQYYDGTAWQPANIVGNAGKVLDELNALRTVTGQIYNARIYKPATPGNALGVEVY